MLLSFSPIFHLASRRQVHDRAYVFLTKPAASKPSSPVTFKDLDCLHNSSRGSTLTWQRLRGQADISCSTRGAAKQAAASQGSGAATVRQERQRGRKGREIHSGAMASSQVGGNAERTVYGSKAQPSDSAQYQEGLIPDCKCARAGLTTENRASNNNAASTGATEGNSTSRTSLACTTACANDTAGAAIATVPILLEMERVKLEAMQVGRARVAVVDRSGEGRVPLWEMRMREGDSLDILVSLLRVRCTSL